MTDHTEIAKGFYQKLIAFFQQRGEKLPTLNYPSHSFFEGNFSTCVFWHFLFSLPLAKKNFLNAQPNIHRKILSHFKSIENYFFPSQLQILFTQPEFSFLTEEDKKKLNEILTQEAYLYATFLEEEKRKKIPSSYESLILQMGEKYFANSNLDFQKNIAWRFAQVFHAMGLPCLHSQRTYLWCASFQENWQKEFLYRDWVELLQFFTEKQDFEYAMGYVLEDPFLEREFFAFCYPQTELAKKNKKITTLLLLNKEEEVSLMELIDFLYLPRMNGSVIGAITKTNLMKESFKNFPPHPPPHLEDWFAFWEGVKFFSKKKAALEIKEEIDQEKIFFKHPQVASKWFCSMSKERPQESLFCLFLNNNHQMIDYCEVTRGTVNQTIAHPREVFSLAVRYNAVSLILIHNHPSGSAVPSVKDREVTQRMEKSGEILGIKVLDHIVMGKNQFYSFSENCFFPIHPEEKIN